jgi:hypothetical protein
LVDPFEIQKSKPEIMRIMDGNQNNEADAKIRDAADSGSQRGIENPEREVVTVGIVGDFQQKNHQKGKEYQRPALVQHATQDSEYFPMPKGKHTPPHDGVSCKGSHFNRGKIGVNQS